MRFEFMLLLLSAAHCVLAQFTIYPPEEEEEPETVITSSVDAVLDRTATLPCDIEPDTKKDRVYMVLWYREDHHKPIYRYDVRGRAFNKALHQPDLQMFGPRAYFVTVSKPAALTIDGVGLDDKGVYRCRVDFKEGPTRNFAINLTIIVPPYQLLVYDGSGREVSGKNVGPLEEGKDLILTCEVRGGQPPPTVNWFMNERLIEGQIDHIGKSVIVNRLEINKVTREMLNSTFKCQASNTKLAMPTEKTVQLELLLKPLKVSITSKPRLLVANEDVAIHCEVLGSRPKAVVTWLRDNRPFRRGKVTEEGNDTVVISTVSFAPVPEDDGTILKCIGDNPLLPKVEQEDAFKLNVVYPPQVVLHMGSTLNPEHIKEGDDVYFECNIKANPREHKITWIHDGNVVNQNLSSGIIISAHSLVLQKVTRWQSGAYTCLAVNNRGETQSSPVNLRVRYVPVCNKDTEITVIGASLDEELRVRCQVSADPSDVEFFWQFNNSGESFDVSPSKFVNSSGNISELKYQPTSQRDYGTLTCRGMNSIGTQAEPCVFQVVPAAKPNPLTNCTMKTPSNHSNEIVEVECRAGYDGGLPQKFVLEAYDAHSLRLRFNLTVADTDTPVFSLNLGELMPSPPSLRIVVYALNAKGRSEKLVLEDIMLNDAEKRTDGGNSMTLVPLAGLLTGSLLTLGIAVLVIIVVAVRRRRHCDDRRHCSHHLAIDATKHQPKSREGSMLEINTGDNRYVVAYTLKPASDCGPTQPSPPPLVTPPDPRRQPDILNTPRGADLTPSLSRPEGLFSHADLQRHQLNSSPVFANFQSSSPGGEVCNTLGRSRPKPREYSNFATMRRDHIIADSIPGPESCV